MHSQIKLLILHEICEKKVWQTHLSEKERDFLAQFLPSGLDVQQVVQALLAGDNFHFGNPFHEWQVFLYHFQYRLYSLAFDISCNALISVFRFIF